MGIATRIYFAILSAFSIFWAFALWFFENNATTIIKIMTTIVLSLISGISVFITFTKEMK